MKSVKNNTVNSTLFVYVQWIFSGRNESECDGFRNLRTNHPPLMIKNSIVDTTY